MVPDTHAEDNTKSTEKQKFLNITIGMYNIVDGRANRLKLACKRLQRQGVDIGILTETKVNGFYTVLAYGYHIWASKCENKHQGGIALIHRDSEEWHIEDVELFGIRDSIYFFLFVSKVCIEPRTCRLLGSSNN